MQELKFMYAYYEKIINELLSNDYIIANYYNYKHFPKSCIIRHDVDYDVHKAQKFAEFEANMTNQVFSTYFFLITSEFYNVFSLQALRVINNILSLGHEIGLHFDETKYLINNDENLFKEYVDEELFLLEKAVGTPIKVVSMHRPSKYTLERNIKFGNAVNSYSQEFFKKFKYLSDSRMNWREDVISVIKENKYNKIHLLTHPFWYSEKETGTKEKILQFINKASYDRYQNLADNFRDLNEFVKKEDIR